jgi:hypothetical protein
MEYKIIENEVTKSLVSENLNYFFNKTTGFSAVWGKTKEEDPDFSPFGPFIVDMEITTICRGPGGILCPFCYKANTPNGAYMSFPTFKTVFDKLPDTVQQIAFGVDAQCKSNPEVWNIMGYCRSKGVIPNVTVADISDETADKLTSLCGAVAVSRYSDKNYCYDSVKKLVDRGMKQTNIHQMLSVQTLPQVWETLNDILDGEPRLQGLNAIVFLSLKQKGRGVNYTSLSQEDFSRVVNFCMEHKISYGFDSCSCSKFLKSVKGHEQEEQFKMVAEPCESTRFSAYIDTFGNFIPCSFMPGVNGWDRGLSVPECNDFVQDIWNHEKTIQFRDKCVSCMHDNKACQYFEV